MASLWRREQRGMDEERRQGESDRVTRDRELIYLVWKMRVKSCSLKMTLADSLQMFFM